jgi:hypothetical protein
MRNTTRLISKPYLHLPTVAINTGKSDFRSLYKHASLSAESQLKGRLGIGNACRYTKSSVVICDSLAADYRLYKKDVFYGEIIA